MQLVTTLPGSGKLGGVVATRGRIGAQLVIRAARSQPRSTSQNATRATIGALAAGWRALCAADKAAWNALANGSSSGVNLFTACNRRLMTIGAPGVLTAPGARPTFPPIANLTATVRATAEGPTAEIYAWEITTDPPIAPSFGLVLRSSACLSQAKASIRAGDLRITATAAHQGTPVFLPFTSWLRIWGAAQLLGNITFALNLVDLQSGFASPQVTTTTPTQAQASTPPLTWSTLVSQEGVTIAQIPETIFEQESSPITGP